MKKQNVYFQGSSPHSTTEVDVVDLVLSRHPANTRMLVELIHGSGQIPQLFCSYKPKKYRGSESKTFILLNACHPDITNLYLDIFIRSIGISLYIGPGTACYFYANI